MATQPLNLEQELSELLEQDTFPPPETFVASALVKDRSLHHAAEQDYVEWWAQQSRELLDWAEPFSETLDESNPPFFKWFADGTLNASVQCLDRHVEAGLGERVAFHWYGEEGEQRDITYAELLADVQKLANALKARGIGPGDVVGLFLPMIPEVVVSMLACARIGAPHNVVLGGFSVESVKERMEVSEAKALVTVDGARRKGKTAEVKASVDAVIGEVASIETIFVVRHTGIDVEMVEGRDHWVDEAMD